MRWENFKEMDFDLSNKVSDIDDLSNNSSKLDFHVHSFEQEMKKIEAFKRELPHCMQLLKDAIERLKEESGREVVEDLTLIRNYEGDGRVKASNDFMEKKNCLSSISRNQNSVFPRNGGGAFCPFKKSTSNVEVDAAKVEKKQRRCWSPELHKIFVDALQQLGGAQKATPKQIREVMNVDGLTNDEVKSHLQKYRIHIKRVDPGRAGAGQHLAIADQTTL